MSDVTDLKAEVLLLRQENAELRDEIKLNPLECALSETQALRGQVAALQAENAELRNENKELHAEQAHWELGNCPSCPNVADLQKALEQNGKLREFAAHMANALGIDSEWCDTSWCDTDCMVEFGCQPACCDGETRCPAWARLKELGVVS